MDSKRSRSTKKVSWNDLAFINNVISWSLEDIFDQDLYKNQMDSIGLTFDFAKQYFNSFVPPLLEETRVQLCSCIEIISSSPHAQVFSLQRSHSLQYGSNLHRVETGSFSGDEKELYKSGAVFILADFKPQTVNDFKRNGNWWHLVFSVGISKGEGY
ncbi:unnamed protein product [Lathyrus oleraceus]|uniref:DUF6469 domain-containing protein n=1 Tax=Pisum sativum TaxID=3888 RepID=A0A9D4VF06_PEA|nr:hypothetical protein KIW84_070057 [Pisum sativum]